MNKKNNIVVFFILLVIVVIMICTPAIAGSNVLPDYDTSGETYYTVIFKSNPTAGEFNIDERYKLVDFVQNNDLEWETVLESPEPNVAEIITGDSPLSLEEIENSPPPECNLYYFIDVDGNIQLRAYGEKHEYIIRNNPDGTQEIFVAMAPEPDDFGMYIITPHRIKVGDASFISFTNYGVSYAVLSGEGESDDGIKPVDLDEEPFGNN